MRPPPDFGSFKRVVAVPRRFVFNHRVSGLHVGLPRSFRFGVVMAISMAISFFREATAECGNWLLLVMLSSGDAKRALRLLGDEWSAALLRLKPWLNDPAACWGRLAAKRRRGRQKRWFQDLSRHFS
jgi:hypothetical protein